MKTLTYLKAKSEDAEFLTAVAYQSKQYWGYSDELMESWRSDLVISPEYIVENIVVKVFDATRFIGFYSLTKNETYACYEIDNLFITPKNVRKGYGKKVYHKIIFDLKKLGESKLILIADPNAKGFYDVLGGVVVGKFQSVVSGRYLDVYEFRI